MMLTRGCQSRLLVLAGSGNFRAVFTTFIIAGSVQSASTGILSPLGFKIAELWTIDGGAARDIALLIKLSPLGKLIFAIALYGVVIAFAAHRRLRWSGLIGGTAVGAIIALAWCFTSIISSTGFELSYPMGISFSGPLAKVLSALENSPRHWLGFDGSLVPGVCIGSLIAAVTACQFRFEWFEDLRSAVPYLIGGMLMGVGAVLAGGCSVGAGLTGTAIFSSTSWVALAAMCCGGIVTRLVIKIVRARASQRVHEPLSAR